MHKKKRFGFIEQPINYLKSRAAIKRGGNRFRVNIQSLPRSRKIKLKISVKGKLFKFLRVNKLLSKSRWPNKHLYAMITGQQVVIGGRTPNSHCRLGITMIKGISGALNVPITSIEGRIKDSESLRKKLMTDKTFRRLLQTKDSERKRALEDSLQGEWIGIRIIVESEADLRKLSEAVKQFEIEYSDPATNQKGLMGLDNTKDYVEKPRKDGLILGEDPNDEYRALHLFTHGLTGAPMEIQFWTTDMKKNVQHLNDKYGKKYGEKYWKSPEFRRGKKAIRDSR